MTDDSRKDPAPSTDKPAATAAPAVPPRAGGKPVPAIPVSTSATPAKPVKPTPVAPKVITPPATAPVAPRLVKPAAPASPAPVAAIPAKPVVPTSVPAASQKPVAPQTPARPAVVVPPKVASAAPAAPAAVPAPAKPSPDASPAPKPPTPPAPRAAAPAAKPARPFTAADRSAETSPLGNESAAEALAAAREAAAARAPASAAAAPATPATAAKPVAPKLAEPASPKPPLPKKPSGPDPLIGRTIGRCRIQSHVGAGRTAMVYRAHHEGLGTDVAVKILLPEILQFPDVVAKFEQEARAIARLDHPNVLKIYDVVTEGDTRGIVMELLEGESVLDYLDGERVEPQDALRIVRQAASGLQAAHAKGIIHRDVKPQNLVILEDGTVKLVDFGLATQSNSSLAAERIGTPHYMAPEVCEAKPVEPASDVYSLGITLFHLLTGHPPFAGQSVKEILASHIAGKPLQPEREVKSLSGPLADLVRGMTKRDPLTRLSIDALIGAIDRIGGVELEQQIKLAPRRGRRRRRAASSGPAALAIGGGALVVIVGLVLALSSRKTPESPRTTPTAQEPEGAAPAAPESSMDDPSSPSRPPPETPEQRRAREKQEAEDRKLEAERRFEKAEGYARANETDKVGIVQKYKELAGDYPDLERGKEARRRAEGIAKGTIHPHPDKKFAEKSAVDKAREEWDKARAPVEQAVAQKLYDDALRALPQSVEDPDHKIGPEIELWRQLLRRLPEFLKTLEKEAQSLKPAERTLGTPKGVGRWVSTSAAGPVVEVGGEKLELRWADVPPESVADLASRAFERKDVSLKAGLAGFAWAHRLRETFYSAMISVKTAGEQTPGYGFVSEMLSRANERFAKPKEPAKDGDAPPK